MGDQTLKKIMYALIAAVVVLGGVLAYIWYQKSSLVKDLTLEKEDLEIDTLFEDPKVSCDPAECTRLGNRKEQIAARLEELYTLWEELQESEE